MKIITIGREFGSGGREVGKRLADILGFDYYDREIISLLSDNISGYFDGTVDSYSWQSVPMTFRHSFAVPMVMNQPQTNLVLEQKRVIEEIATKGRDCIIVGRNADVILEKYKPLSIFVCADIESKVQRCIERAESGEKLTRKQLESNMKKIDKNRAMTREFICDHKWGDPRSYTITINTSGWNIKELTKGVADFANHYFEVKNDHKSR